VKVPESVLILVPWFYFFRFLSQGPAIGSNVPKNGVYSTFWYKVFSVEMPETSFLKYKKLNVSYISPWLYFSGKKCAKMTSLIIEVIIRKSKCHQKIPWVWFDGNDISNYGLILTTANFRKKIKIFTKILFRSLAPYVFKIRP
jgi:hypothetical protein